MFPLIGKSREGKTDTIILLWRRKEPCETWWVWDADAGAAPRGVPAPFCARRMETGSCAATHPALLDFTRYQGKAGGQNIFQQTAAKVNDTIRILKLETSAPEAGFGSPLSRCKVVNSLRVRDISQLFPDCSPLKYRCLVIRAESADVSAQIGPTAQVFQGI